MALVESPRINGARALMADRKHPRRSRDNFPTPPWATRALMERVFPQLGYFGGGGSWTIWEPACGQGIMAEVLREYFRQVTASDKWDYGYRPMEKYNFLDDNFGHIDFDWIVSNPPFGNLSIPFVERALSLAKVGVAMFVRSQWAVEGLERYQKIFRDNPPTLCAFFVERVNLCKGRWNPDGTTATAYCWLVWVKGMQPQPPMWIPPGCRKQLTKSDDRERFAKRPRKRR